MFDLATFIGFILAPFAYLIDALLAIFSGGA